MLRRSSGSPPVRRIFSTPWRDEDAREARDLLEGEQLGARQELVVGAEHLLRHAVDAAEVAAVGDRDAQVAQAPAPRVGQHARNGRSARRGAHEAVERLAARDARTSVSGMITGMSWRAECRMKMQSVMLAEPGARGV